MCLMKSRVRNVVGWNWGGDTIVQSPIVPSSQTIPRTKKTYDVYIREYLLGRENAVIRRALDEILESLPADEQKIFLSRKQGSFDFRMRAITGYIYDRVAYARGSRHHDAWLYPDQTLANQAGDCEDRAFLVASLLIASGISSYVVRVAMGKLYNQTKNVSKDHAWVMYRNEDGAWLLIEPLLYTKDAHKQTQKLAPAKAKKNVREDTFEYIPYFVFNNDHMWRIRNNTDGLSFSDYLEKRDFWEDFDPTFAAGVHSSIFDEVLKDMPWYQLQYVKLVSLNQDVNTFAYDPRDHFDNGYIQESWDLMMDRIKDESKSLDGLARAGHAIADFYAHSSYGHFGPKSGETLKIFDGNLASFKVDYSSGEFNVGAGSRFTVNDARCEMTADQRVEYCNKQELISGRFAQPDDPHQSAIEKIAIYIPYPLRTAPDFPPRYCLPHHDEIAVDDVLDDGKLPSRHALYTAKEYQQQFKMRKDAAVRHFSQLYQMWKS